MVKEECQKCETAAAILSPEAHAPTHEDSSRGGGSRRLDREHLPVLLEAARRRAIAQLEAFIEAHPSHPTDTPDAMLRLAELYFDDSYQRFIDQSDRFEEALERYKMGEELDLPDEPMRDFSRTIGLLRRLIGEHPSFKHLDGALYLLGYCLNEMGEVEEALLAWRHLVCSDSFQYRRPTPPEPEPDGPLALRRAEEEGPFTDPYASCRPLRTGSRFLIETWFRIGEYHFDYDYAAHGLRRAISAYQRAMSDPEHPLFHNAVYKLAWAHYRSDQFPEAIRHFTRILELAEERPEATIDLRPEAVQYLGICFAENDWDFDADPDATSSIERLQDANLLPQDRPFTREVYVQTADTLFDLARYEDAIRLFELVLRRWPLALEGHRDDQAAPRPIAAFSVGTCGLFDHISFQNTDYT